MSIRMDSRKRVLLQVLVLSLSCWVLAGTTIAQPRNDGEVSTKTRTELSEPNFGNSFEKYDNLRIVASIDNLRNDQYEIVEFTLDRDKILRLYAIGEGMPAGIRDFGGIENVQTGQLVWVMHYLSTVHASGADKNRKVDRLLPLPAGAYRLHFKTDHVHSFNNWNDALPDHNWWGIPCCFYRDRVPALSWPNLFLLCIEKNPQSHPSACRTTSCNNYFAAQR